MAIDRIKSVPTVLPVVEEKKKFTQSFIVENPRRVLKSFQTASPIIINNEMGLSTHLRMKYRNGKMQEAQPADFTVLSNLIDLEEMTVETVVSFERVVPKVDK